jgi:hypothetical protein
VFYPESGQDNQSTTTVQVFGAGSSKPQLTQSIPLTLPSAVWFGTHDGSSRSYNLVALTDTSKVVVLGNDPNVAQSKPSSMALGFATQKPSLFQDIFGSPLDTAGPSVIAESSAAAQAAASSKKEDAFPFPAFLAPSLSSMFNPLVKGFLVEREEQGERDSGKEVEEDDEDDMDVDDPTFVSKPATTQLAFSADQLVSFFKKQSACESFPYGPNRSTRLTKIPVAPLRTPARTNGVAKLTNGTHPQPASASRKEGSRTHKKSSV